MEDELVLCVGFGVAEGFAEGFAVAPVVVLPEELLPEVLVPAVAVLCGFWVAVDEELAVAEGTADGGAAV